MHPDDLRPERVGGGLQERVFTTRGFGTENSRQRADLVVSSTNGRRKSPRGLQCRCRMRLWESRDVPPLHSSQVGFVVGVSGSRRERLKARQALGAALEVQVQNLE